MWDYCIIGKKWEGFDLRKKIGMAMLAAGAVLIIAGIALLLAFNKPSGTAREHFKSGLKAAANDNAMVAISEYSAAIELNPGFIAVYRKRAEAYRSKGDLFSSADDYEKVIKAGSKNPGDYVALMSIYVARGDQGLAFALVNKVTRLDKNNPAIWQAIGDLYFKSGLYAEALNAYGHAAALRPKSGRPRVSQARIFEILAQYDRAKEAFDAAIAAEPKNPMYLFVRGNYLTRRLQYPEAVADYEAALALESGYYEAEVGIGRAYFLMGNYGKALTAMSNAIIGSPNRYEAYRDRIDVYIAMGDNKRAAEDCRAVLKLTKDLTEKSKASIKLQKLLN
jgi:tetratricopeptide (TPR) repeat protein